MNGCISITIIIPAYNAEKTIRRTLNSLEKQTNKNFKCVIVNDGSTDQTRLEIEKLMSDLSFNVLVVDKENEGVISARYTALQYVDTEFV